MGTSTCYGTRRVALLSVMVVGLSGASATAGTVYVSKIGDDTNDGRSWSASKATLQAALDVAVSGDQVWVAAGSYRPTALTQPSNPRTAAFQLINGVRIYGGFAGTEPPTFHLANRDLVANETILTGDLNDDDATAGNGENSYHVVFGMYLDSTAVLDGVTITAGNANDRSVSASPNASGGGMVNAYGSPTLANCLFRGNAADAGGGMLSAYGSPTLIDCVFSENAAVNGGGGMANAYDSHPSLVRCTFSGNSTSGTAGGGAMFNIDNCHPSLSDCTFSGNLATGGSGGGAMTNAEGSNPTLTRCEFVGNSAAGGGAMLNHGSMPDMRLTDCTFVGNSAANDGGAIYNISSSPTLIGCEFRANTATWGGGMFNRYAESAPALVNCRFLGNAAEEGGGLYNYASAPTLVNCEFVGNRALHDGGGMNNWDSSHPTLIHCTFSGNVATLERGGGIYNHQAGATLVNCVLWGNLASAGPQVALERQTAPCELTVRYSDLEGGVAAVHMDPGATLNWGAGNLSHNPLFVRNPDPGSDGTWATPDDDYGNLHLLPGSPCIDAGSNPDVPADVADLDGDGNTSEPQPFDLAGAARFADDPYVSDTGSGTAPIVDMGAYEHHCGDIDGDGHVNVFDIFCIAECWNTQAGDPTFDPRCDLDGDGFVNIFDIFIIAENWNR